MFFSIIVPTYNPKDCLGTLLSSLLRNDCVKDMEIILSDDCSDEPFDETIEAFPNLNIKLIQNEYHSGFPRNGRQHGSEVATGDWICFVDQDDYFVDNGLDKIKKHIEENDIHNYLASDFLFHVEGTTEATVYNGKEGWTHGKFYEKSFWDKYHLGFDDVQYCEDINLSTITGCIITANDIKMNYFHDPVYVWNRKYGSLSLSDDYFSKSMPDYIRGTFGVIERFIEKYKSNEIIVSALIPYFINTIYHLYFYFQTDIMNEDIKYILDAALVLYPIYKDFKENTGLTSDEVISKTKNEYSIMYTESRNTDYIIRPFVEKISFEQWMKSYFN